MKIQVLLPNRDRPAALVEQIDAVLAQERAEFSVTILDQSTGAAIREVADRYAGRVGYRRIRERGLSNALNEALDPCEAPAVAVLSDRAVPRPGWLAALGAELDGPDRPDMVFGGLDPDRQPEAGVLLAATPGPERKVFRDRPRAFAGHGANMALRVDAWRRAGGFDPALGPGARLGTFEDADLVARVVLAGGTVVYRPDARCVFHQERSWAVLGPMLRSYGRGAGAFAAKQLRLGRPGLAAALLGGWMLHNGLRVVAGGCLRLRAVRVAAGLTQLTAPWVGFARGLVQPLDRDRGVFRSESGS